MKRSISSLLCGLLLLSACSKLPMDEQRAVEYYSNTFAFNVMNTYYLWKDEAEVARELDDWGTREDAVQKVKACRYPADRWTTLYEDCTPFENYVNGSGLTYGLDYSAYYTDSGKTQVVAVVRFTYADSPARKAGLKRGDVIETIGGQTMDKENYRSLLGQLGTSTSIQLGLADDQDFLLRNSDIVTLHVPLTEQTRGMADKAFFSKMKLGSFFVNTARGEVVDEEALISASDKFGALIIDTWRNEPNINRRLLEVADIATPHIAGYSYQGKLKGTSMAVRAVARYLGIKELYEFFPQPEGQPSDAVKLNLRGKPQGQIASIIQYNYPIFTDDFMFRLAPETFENLRENYCYRREFFID